MKGRGKYIFTLASLLAIVFFIAFSINSCKNESKKDVALIAIKKTPISNVLICLFF